MSTSKFFTKFGLMVIAYLAMGAILIALAMAWSKRKKRNKDVHYEDLR